METKKICLVPGGSGGMGSEICSRLAENGFSVGIGYHNSKKPANSLENKIKSNGHAACCVNLDINDEESVKRGIEAVENAFGGKVLYLVYAAGAKFQYKSIASLSWEQIQLQLDLLARGGWYCLKAMIPQMAEAKFGRIVFINSSVTWGVPPPSLTDYVIGRYSQQALMKAAAVELGPKGINVNSVSPALTEADSIADIPEIMKKMAASQNPLRRLATPRDIANAVLFLLLDEAAYLNGVDIPVAGGALMR